MRLTKTKPSHYRTAPTGQAPKKRPDWPGTAGGGRLAMEVRECPTWDEALKTRLVREIVDCERSHAQITKTFTQVRKRLHPPPAR